MPLTLQSSLFGNVVYKAGEIYIFKHGIPGFPSLHEFIFLKIEDSPFVVMHAIEQDIYFFLIDPFSIYSDYEFSLPDSVIEQLEIDTREDVVCYSIVALCDPIVDSTVNLAGPILLNQAKRLGMQMVVDNSPYSVKTPLCLSVPQEAARKAGE